jgi:hypothetical protein
MSAANPNLMETSMVSVLVVANTGGGLLLPCGVPSLLLDNMESTFQTVFDKLDNLTRKVDKIALEEVVCTRPTTSPPPKQQPSKLLLTPL